MYILILSNKNENIIKLIIFFKKNAEKFLKYEKSNYIINLNK